MNQTFLLMASPPSRAFGHEPDRREEDAPVAGGGLDAIEATACLALLDNRPKLERSSIHERRSFPQLQAFLAVARLRSFSSAARELGVTRSAVSQAVRQLEEQLRVVLLARTTRSVSVTEAGRRLVESAGPALGLALAALSEASAQPGEVVVRVRLLVPRVAVPFVIDPVLPTFRTRYPPVEVEVAVDDRFVRGHRGGGVRRRGAAQRGHRARHGAGAAHGAIHIDKRKIAHWRDYMDSLAAWNALRG
jgi:DNA-binding MarR family transcriptional regulator